ncbi:MULTISPECIES: energy transducer TonB [Leptospira]|uniref:Energy transducer TonB n=3 Tax=Leptospira TaxID=171 RepID=A0A4Z1AK66_9LEPT|nr:MULTISPECIES: energy transducer TonB [Leptospira]PKA16314.1 energy transducer TonB [Leptospira haakeii]PKA19804.1 energy transducer TonB [Leptospira haakeii]TGK41339.1 energy transducer TonB [Leptospira andrefontaineae]TGN00125.1 energy transducer TonB [Leptospira dzoumogneensis]
MNPTLEKVKTDVIQKLKELSLWEICVYGSLAFHLFLFLTYYYITHKEKEFVDSEQLEMNVEVDIQDIPPELLGGETSPTHKDPNEWVEGANEEGKDPDPNEIKENEISGEGTDKDGFLFAFYGDKAPTPIIDFSLRDYFPENARAQGISDAMIYLEVQVDEKGNLINAKVIKSSIRGYGFEEAAVKVIRLARWSPGYAKGRPTRMNHRVPVHFELDDN